MKKLFLIPLLILGLMVPAAYGDELISEQTQDTTPAATDLLVAELTDNSDFIYFTLQQMVTAILGANYDTSGELDTLFAAKLANVVEDTTPQLGGNLDINDKWISDNADTLTADDTTPAVTGGMYYITANTGATSITDFVDSDGDHSEFDALHTAAALWIIVVVNDATTTFDFTSSNLVGLSADYLAGSGESFMFVFNDATDKWHLVGSASEVSDTAYNVTTWDGVLDAASKNALRDYFYTIDADGDGKIDLLEDTLAWSGDLTGDGQDPQVVEGNVDHDSLANFVAAEHYRWDNDISGTATIHDSNLTITENATFGAGWDDDIVHAPTQDAIYEWGAVFDTDFDGKVNVVDLSTAGPVSTNSSGVLASAATLTHEMGGLEADVNAYAGYVKISGGSTSAVAVTANGESLITAANYAAMKTLLDTDDIQTLTGVAAGTAHLGTFTGAIITDSSTIKTALQELETEVEGLPGGHDAVTIAAGITGLTKDGAQELSLHAYVEDAAEFTDPNADRIWFWDDDAGVFTGLVVGTGLDITATTITAPGVGDVLSVGDCTEGACLDGTVDGGTNILFYDAQGATTLQTGDTSGAIVLTLPAVATGTLYATGNTDVALADGGTGESLTDPGFDRIMFWDDSDTAVEWLIPATNVLEISANTLTISDNDAARIAIGLDIDSDVQAYSAVLDTYTGIDPAANVQAILGAADYAAIRTLMDLEAGTDFYTISAANTAHEAADAAIVKSDEAETLSANWVNTANPWADNEVANAQTITAQAGSTWNEADSVTALSVYTGTTSLEETTAANDSGAYIVGVYTTGFTNSSGVNVQGVLSDLDGAISAASNTDYDLIDDPATGNGSIAMGAYTGTYTTGTDQWGGMFITNTQAAITGASELLTLTFADTESSGSSGDLAFLTMVLDATTITKFTEDGLIIGTGTPTITFDGGDLYVTGDTEIVGTLKVGALDMLGAANPVYTWNDSDASTTADEEAMQINANLSEAADQDDEIADWWITSMHDDGVSNNSAAPMTNLLWDGSAYSLFMGVLVDGVAGTELAGYESLKWDFYDGGSGIIVTSPSSSTIDFQIATVTFDAIVASGDITTTEDLVIGDSKYIGSTSDTDAMQIEADGDIVFSQDSDVVGAFTAGSVVSDAGVGGTVITASTSHIGPLLDAAGDEDMDYGSADVDDHTFTTDGTGTSEIVLPAGSIDGTEILDDTIDSADYAAASIDNEHLANNAVDSDELAAGSVDVGHMSVNSIDSDQYVDASIDLAHMSSQSVDSDNIVDATIAVGDMAVNSIDSDQYVDGSIDIAHMSTDSVDYDNTTGSIKALTPVTDSAANFAANFTGANLYGGTFVCNVTGSPQLPAPVAGMHFTIITLGAFAVTLLPTAGDDFILDGVQLDDNHDALNASTAGDIAVVQYYDADGWLVTTNGWTEVAD